jgi:hypothetical protein
MFNWFRKRPLGTGAVDDPRAPEAKAKDFRAEEVLAFGVPEWREKPENEWRKYPIFNQDGSGSCVAQSKAKEAGILNFLEEGLFMELSARDVYARRSNKPSAGMWGQDANEIVRKAGITLKSLMPSDNLDEVAMNNDSDRKKSFEVIGKVFRAKAWFAVPFNFDAIAQILDTGKGVNLFFRWDYDEWDREVPLLNPASKLSYHHSVVAVDRTLHNGKKALVIEDSWGTNRGINGRRIVTEEWVSRMTWASYFEDLSNLEMLNAGLTELPKYVFTRTLKTGNKGFDVAQLQRCLGYLKDGDGYLFPLAQEPTGNYYGITAKAVERFQKMNGLAANGMVDEPTRLKLNETFK